MALIKQLRQPAPEDWEPGPAEYDIANGDDVKVKFRKYVEDYLDSCKDVKSLLKKKFVIISTNVLCAVTDSDRDHMPNHIRDLYMPVELTVTKLSMETEEKNYVMHHFMFYPGEPARNGRIEARLHLPKHKIENIEDGPLATPPSKYGDVLSKIYQLVHQDYTLFSLSLKHVRQDLGCIKWLIDQVCGIDGNRKKYKPLNIYSIHDLYVLMCRRVFLDGGSIIGSMVAEKQLGCTNYEHEIEYLCDYHKQDQYETAYCTRANCYAKAKRFKEDVARFRSISDALSTDVSKLSISERPSSSTNVSATNKPSSTSKVSSANKLPSSSKQ